ncbi:tetratricopeptide repeat protein [Maribacter sp.]|nr:tetratricopeptide repeat protein [Maribacter sp.]
MKSKAIYLVGLLICVFHAYTLVGQNQEKIDSLKQILKKESNDSTKIGTYYGLYDIYLKSKTTDDIALKYADSVYLYSKNSANEKGIMLSHYMYAELNQFEGDYPSAIKHLLPYLEYNKTRGNALEVAKTLFTLGKSYKNMGDFDIALMRLYRSASIYDSIKNKDGLAKTYLSIGGILNRSGKPEEAIAYYSKANDINKNLGNTLKYAMGLQNIGNVHGVNKQYEKSINYYKQALDFITPLNHSYEKAMILGNLGGAYTGLNQHHVALEYHLKAHEIRKTLSNKRTLAYGLANIGTSFMKLKRFPEAQKNIDDGLNLAMEIGSKSLIAQIFDLKAKLGTEKGDFKMAYDNIKTSYRWKDSIFNEKTNLQINELQTKYETAQKDKEITVLTKENQLQEANSQKEATLRKALYGGLISLVIIAGLIFYSMRQRLRNQKVVVAKNEEITRAQLSEELQALEMKALRAQMNPHFLFNSLNSINTMILNDEPHNASKYLSKFSKLVRLMLENSEQSKVSLKDELDTLEAYIQLEAIRFNNKMDYKIEVADEIDQEGTYLPSMVLQPFVENAIWHGLLHKDQKGLLTVNIKETNDNLLCSIIDNGVGREKSLTLKKDGGLKKKSMGIKITTDRLKLLTKQKIKDVINIIDLKDHDNKALGTQVNIQIPLS